MRAFKRFPKVLSGLTGILWGISMRVLRAFQPHGVLGCHGAVIAGRGVANVGSWCLGDWGLRL